MNPLLFTLIGDVGRALINKMWPDPAAQATAQLELLKLQQAGEFKELDVQLQLALAQAQINQAEANSGSNFRGGWRPLCGWVCGLGLGYQFLLRPISNGLFTYYGHGAPMPDLDTNTLMTLLGGMLGFGGLRTLERLKGKA
jgi:hypothetical protein